MESITVKYQDNGLLNLSLQIPYQVTKTMHCNGRLTQADVFQANKSPAMTIILTILLGTATLAH